LNYDGDRIEGQWVSASHSVTIITDETKDADGLCEGFAAAAGGRAGSPPLFGESPPYQLIVDDPIRLGPHKVAVRFRTSTYRKPKFLRPTPDGLQWSITVIIDGEGSQPTYTVMGGWSGAHAAELTINGRLIYRKAAPVPQSTPQPPPLPAHTPPDCPNPHCSGPNCKLHHCKEPTHAFSHCTDPNCKNPNCKDHHCKEPQCEDKSSFAEKLVGDLLDSVFDGLVKGLKGKPKSVTSGRIEMNGPVRAPASRL
jgi:hypothetical protein